MLNRSVLLVVAGILVGSLGVYGVTQVRGQTQENESEAAVSQDPVPPESSDPVITRVGALGRLTPRGEVVEVGGPVGERIGQLLVEEGQSVVTGMELVRLENYDEVVAQRNYATAQVEEAQERLKAEVALAEAQIAEAQTRILQVEQPQTEAIQAQKATLRQLQAELSDAKADLARFEQLFQEGAVAEQAYEDEVLKVEQKQEALNNAQSRLAEIEETRRVNLTNARAQVEAAEANLLVARTQVQLQSLQRNVELAEARLERSIIRAPQDGTILNTLYHPGEAIIAEEGILELGNTEQMMVIAEVYETDIRRIQVGQSAEITSSVFEDPLVGVVDFVGLQVGKLDVLSTDPAAAVDARVVEVKIALDPDSSVIAAGLTNLQVTVAIDVP